MRGSGNILGAVHTTEPVGSQYMYTYKGLMPKYETKPVVFNAAVSCSTGTVIPDPLLMTSIFNQQEEFQRSLKKVHSMAASTF